MGYSMGGASKKVFRVELLGTELRAPPVLYVEAEGLDDITDRVHHLLDGWPECERVEISIDGNLLAIPRQRLFKAS